MNRTYASQTSSAHEELPAPRFKETNDTFVPLPCLREKLTVIVPPITTATAKSNAMVILTSQYGSTRKTFEIPAPQQPTAVEFFAKDLNAIAGTGYVQYMLLSGAGASAHTETYFQEALPTPRLKGVEHSWSDAYRLSAESAQDGIIVTIAPYEGIAIGDSVTLYANASSELSAEWQTQTVGNDERVHGLEFIYAAEKLKASRPGTIKLGYFISNSEARRFSRAIEITLAPLLPHPEPKYQEHHPAGLAYFLNVVHEEDGHCYAPVIQHFHREQPQAGDQLMLLIDAEGRGFNCVIDIEHTTPEVTFKVGQTALNAMNGQTVNMKTLWRRCKGTPQLTTSEGRNWLVSGTMNSSREGAQDPDWMGG